MCFCESIAALPCFLQVINCSANIQFLSYAKCCNHDEICSHYVAIIIRILYLHSVISASVAMHVTWLCFVRCIRYHLFGSLNCAEQMDIQSQIKNK